MRVNASIAWVKSANVIRRELARLGTRKREERNNEIFLWRRKKIPECYPHGYKNKHLSLPLSRETLQ